jgi:hypothetical protein
MSALRNDGIELGRREHQRFAVEIDAEITTEAGTFGAVTKDLSRGGICFVVLAPMAVGTIFNVSISLVLGENMFSEPLVLRGQVIWCTKTDEGYQIGAGFAELTPQARKFLQLFLNFLAEGVNVGQEAHHEHEEEDEDEEEEKGLFA